MNSKILLSHSTGNPNVRGVLEGLHRNGMLHSFHTSVACFPDSLFDKISFFPLFKDLKKRNFSSDIRSKTISYPYMELGRMLSRKFNISKWLEHEKGKFCIEQVCHSFDLNVANYVCKHHKNISAVYTYEDNAFNTFKQAKEFGIKCIYDLPIAYWEYGTQLMIEESIRLPRWAATLGGGINDSDAKHERKIKELELSDIVVCASSFVKDSLPLWAKNKPIIEVPFGTPSEICVSAKPISTEEPLRVLFVGSMGQRKGLGDLFKAITMLDTKNVELVVLGSLLAPIEFYKKQLPNFTYEQVRPHCQVLELMRTCDVFCLPSIVEGRALVMQEAMSQGLPIIITPNTGGEDLVIEGETGFLVPIRSPEKIAEKINWFLENRNQLYGMSIKAQQHAEKYTWEQYGNSIADLIQENF
ncbi:D-inositol 3-phosphate glycosyltransferase [termite gut metagenome]|uniref:D-inositol 3-phosphate glycosyltransferase n=1 Tax=termite gut metagenome TaxID=433724 RepID=A0A5J4T0V8_9ZZZZ